MIDMVEGGDMSKVAEMTNRPAQRPVYKERNQAPASYVYSSSNNNNNNNALKPFTERAQKELGQPFVSLRQEVQPPSPRPPAQSYSYFNMKSAPAKNSKFVKNKDRLSYFYLWNTGLITGFSNLLLSF